MSNLIGGFSPSQYRAFLSPSPEKKGSAAGNWISRFNPFQFPYLAVLINRLAYFLLHQFSFYPNNSSLLKKFKSHKFFEIKTKEELTTAQKIFKSFEDLLPEGNEDIQHIRDELGNVDAQLIREEIDKNGKPQKKDDKDSSIDHEKLKKEPPEQQEKIKERDSRDIQDQSKKSKKESDVGFTLDLFELEDKEAEKEPEKKDEPDTGSAKPIEPEKKETGKKEGPITDEKKDSDASLKKEGDSDTPKEEPKGGAPVPPQVDKTKEGDIPPPVQPDTDQKGPVPPKEDVKVPDWIKRADALHAEFKGTFPDNLPKIGDNRVISCSADQYEWLLSKIPLDILVPEQEMFVYRMITGSQVEKMDVLYFSFREVEGKETPSSAKLESSDSLVSSFLVQLYKSRDLKSVFETIAKNYVANWLELPGVVLHIGNQTIPGGCTEFGKRASDWTVAAREVYVKYLKGLTKVQLKEHIELAIGSPFIALLKNAFGETPEEKNHPFSLSLLKKLFNKELVRVAGQPLIHQALRQTIEGSVLSQEEIKALAEKGECPEESIEPLFRIRLLYLMGYLGRNPEEIIEGLIRRTNLMLDPSECEDIDRVILTCEPKELILSFDPSFDQLQMRVDVHFKRPGATVSIGRAASIWSVNSVSKLEGVETNAIDLQDLQFTLSASKAHRDFLLSQIAPEAFVRNCQKLLSRIVELKIHKKLEKFEIAKKENTADSGIDLFNSASFCDAENDGSLLDEAIDCARTELAYLRILCLLKERKQLTESQIGSIEEIDGQVYNTLMTVSNKMKEIYLLAPPENEQLKKIQQLNGYLLEEESDVEGADNKEDSSDTDINESEESDSVDEREPEPTEPAPPSSWWGAITGYFSGGNKAGED